jgi:ribosomal-protein-alanine N-acetyltransferase
MRWWHVEEVAGIERDLFPDDAWSMEQFWQELAQPTRHYVVASDGGQVVGYAGAFVLPPDSDVQTIAVRADRQGSGVASALLANLVDEARAAGCTHLMLEVRADNAPALALYARFGFAQISLRPRYYPDGGDALILRRRLDGATP